MNEPKQLILPFDDECQHEWRPNEYQGHDRSVFCQLCHAHLPEMPPERFKKVSG